MSIPVYMRVRLALSPFVAAATALACTPFASLYVLLNVPHRTPYQLPEALWSWWPIAWDYLRSPMLRSSPALTDALQTTALAMAAVAVAAIAITLVWPRRTWLREARHDGDQDPTIRAASGSRGRAAWMAIPLAIKLYAWAPSPWGHVVIGEGYRVDLDNVASRCEFDEDDPATWGMGGRAPLLMDSFAKGAASGVVVAGSGGLKTESITKPAMLTWTGPIVLLDPSCQVGDLARPLRLGMGHDVAIIDPERPELGAYNAFAGIDIRNRMAEANVRAWVNRNSQPTPKDKGGDNAEYFRDLGKDVQACIMADLLWDPTVPPARKTPREWRARIDIGEKAIKGQLQTIAKESRSRMARSLAGTLFKVHDETWSGVYNSATRDTAWLAIDAYADLVSGDTFNVADIAAGTQDVFLSIPMKTLQSTPALARVIIGTILEAVYDAYRSIRKRVLFLLDEAVLLGRMDILTTVRDQGRKHMISMITMWQDLGQLEDVWGEKQRRAWFNSAAWVMFAAIADIDTAALISKMAGKYTTLVRSEGTSASNQGGFSNTATGTRGRNDNVSEGEADLIRPEDVTQRMRPDEAIIFPRNRPPIRCGRAIAFRRREMRRLSERSLRRAA